MHGQDKHTLLCDPVILLLGKGPTATKAGVKNKSCAGMFIATSFVIVPSTIENHETMKRIAQICSNMSSLAGINVEPKSHTQQRK